VLEGIKVSDDGLVGALYLPSTVSRDRLPAIIVLSGSDGGIATAAMYGEPLAALGYAVLALAYFAMDGLPRDLVEIPLEYFKRAIGWLQAHPSVDPARIGILGHSRGGEAALLIAATYPAIRLVVANVPSHVAWSGTDYDTGEIRSGWSLHGVGVPFLSLARMPDAATSWRTLFEESLRDKAAEEAAAIPVEGINGPILFVTGTDDGVWPCTAMVDAAMVRLRDRAFRFPVEHAKYEAAGHAILTPPYRVGPISNPWPATSYSPPRWGGRVPSSTLGGTADANRLARIDAWPKMTAFLNRHL
jgi:dienelactone hydrolase